jgi:hypothetical protein
MKMPLQFPSPERGSRRRLRTVVLVTLVMTIAFGGAFGGQAGATTATMQLPITCHGVGYSQINGNAGLLSGLTDLHQPTITYRNLYYAPPVRVDGVAGTTAIWWMPALYVWSPSSGWIYFKALPNVWATSFLNLGSTIDAIYWRNHMPSETTEVTSIPNAFSWAIKGRLVWMRGTQTLTWLDVWAPGSC